MSDNGKPGFWKRVIADISVAAVIAGMVWVIWQVVHSHYADEVSVLNDKHSLEIRQRDADKADLTRSYESDKRTLIQERDALRADIDTVRSAYQTLSEKSKGLFGSSLLFTDTLDGNGDLLQLHGGQVEIRPYPMYDGHSVSPKSFSRHTWIAFTYWNKRDSVGGEKAIELNDGERWEYSVAGKQYYLVFTVIDREKPILVVRIFELVPLYHPAG